MWLAGEKFALSDSPCKDQVDEYRSMILVTVWSFPDLAQVLKNTVRVIKSSAGAVTSATNSKWQQTLGFSVISNGGLVTPVGRDAKSLYLVEIF